MLDEISQIPYKDRPWGTTAVQAMISGKRNLALGFLGLGVKSKLPKYRLEKKRQYHNTVNSHVTLNMLFVDRPVK